MTIGHVVITRTITDRLIFSVSSRTASARPRIQISRFCACTLIEAAARPAIPDERAIAQFLRVALSASRTLLAPGRAGGVCASFTGMCIARSDSALGDYWEVPLLRRSGRDRLGVLPRRLGLSARAYRERTPLPTGPLMGPGEDPPPHPALDPSLPATKHPPPRTEPHAAGSLVSSRPWRSRSKRGGCGTHSPAPQNCRIWAPLAERTEHRVGRDLCNVGTGPAAEVLPTRFTA